jgi:hypothetical protein
MVICTCYQYHSSKSRWREKNEWKDELSQFDKTIRMCHGHHGNSGNNCQPCNSDDRDALEQRCEFV